MSSSLSFASVLLNSYVAGWINGFDRNWWSEKHNTHHVLTNHAEHDCDIHVQVREKRNGERNEEDSSHTESKRDERGEDKEEERQRQKTRTKRSTMEKSHREQEKRKTRHKRRRATGHVMALTYCQKERTNARTKIGPEAIVRTKRGEHVAVRPMARTKKKMCGCEDGMRSFVVFPLLLTEPLVADLRDGKIPFIFFGFLQLISALPFPYARLLFSVSLFSSCGRHPRALTTTCASTSTTTPLCCTVCSTCRGASSRLSAQSATVTGKWRSSRWHPATSGTNTKWRALAQCGCVIKAPSSNCSAKEPNQIA